MHNIHCFLFLKLLFGKGMIVRSARGPTPGFVAFLKNPIRRIDVSTSWISDDDNRSSATNVGRARILPEMRYRLDYRSSCRFYKIDPSFVTLGSPSHHSRTANQQMSFFKNRFGNKQITKKETPKQRKRRKLKERNMRMRDMMSWDVPWETDHDIETHEYRDIPLGKVLKKRRRE